jgi:hypothetical protein
MKYKYKMETWAEIKEYANQLEVDWFRLSHVIVLGLLWIGVAFSIFEGEHANAVAFAVIILAWKIKGK